MIKNTVGEEGIEVSERDLELVRDILKTLTKTLKTFNVYPRDNPIYQKFSHDLFEKFSSFCESNDELVLDVDRYSLLFKGSEVLHNEERTDNISLLLYADGIRQLIFYRGLTFEEISDFIDILRLAPKSEANDDDDIVTLLWERNIKNMGYTAVEDVVDDELVVEENLFSDEPGRDYEGAGDGAAARQTGTAWPGSEQPALPAGLQGEPLREEDMEKVQQEAAGFDEKALLSAAAGLFFDLLMKEPDTDALPEIMQNMGRVLEMRIRSRDVHTALEILDRLRELSASYDDPSHIEMIGAAVNRVGTLESLRILFSDISDSRELQRFLAYLGRDALPAMIQLLGELEDRRQRRLLCEVLSEIGKDEIDLFSGSIYDDRWYLVRNIAMILGMTKNPSSVPYLEKISAHGDLRVRREAFRALDSIRSDETKGLFLAALHDPDLTVRITALKALRRFRDPGLFEKIRESASLDELRKKSFIEKKETVETVAALGGELAFPQVSDLFRKRGFIEKEDATEIRVSAAYGLGIIGTPEAASLLEKESGSRKELLRDACQKALKELRQGGNNRR